jgi:DNA topoisomerase-1
VILLLEGAVMTERSDQKSSTECTNAALANARAVGLRYVDDHLAGITRKAGKNGFRYLDAKGQPIKDEQELARIKSLAIPPAWIDVWICRWPNGHIQATGRDAKGRKQYRYHAQWRSVRDDVKYGRMLSFGQALPAIRGKIDTALSLPGLPREKVLAAIVYLLQTTMMRIGNKEYARTNDSFGMTTLRKKHVRVDGTQIQFEFRGKSGIQHSIKMQDRRLARIIKRTRDLPGQELFQYEDADGERHAIGSADVNDYLRELSGEDYTAKDFRTWSGTMLATIALRDIEPAESETQGKKNIVQAIELVSKKLGNTPAICRKCYVHPGVLDAYLDGSLHVIADKAMRSKSKQVETVELETQEAIVLALLKNLANTPASIAASGEKKPKQNKEETKRKLRLVSVKKDEKKPASLMAAG